MGQQYYENKKKELDKKKEKLSRINGEIDSLKQRLSEEFEINSLEDAESEVKELEMKKNKLEKEIQEKLDEIEESYDLNQD